MLFRRRSRSRDSPVAQSSPARDARHHTSDNLPDSRQGTDGSSDGSNRSHDSSSDQSQEYCRQPVPRRTPTSRKTGFATIRTDSTDMHAAFESDAFAVLMPTTRLPIIDRPVSPRKVASPGARAEALKAYQEKARQARERNNSQSVKVPSKIVSYDYASRHVATQRSTPDVEANPPTPAGSFPISPPLPQHAWTQPAQVAKTKLGETRHVLGLSNITPSGKPASTGNDSITPASPTSCYRVFRMDSTEGASRSIPLPTSVPSSIRVRIKPKPVVHEQERVQTESRYSAHDHPPATCLTQRSRSSSPMKSMPNFTASSSVEGDSIFGYKAKDRSGTVAGAASPSNRAKDNAQERTRMKREEALERARAKIAERANKTSPKHTSTTRWPWLRPSGPRTTKPTTTPVVFSTQVKLPTVTAAAATKVYVDPFTAHTSPTPLSTPPTLRPASPKKHTTISRPSIPVQTPLATGTFDTGFAQIKSFTYTVFKIALVLYAIIALWFILDAIRSAFNTLATPFRILKWCGEGIWDLGVWIWEGCCVIWRRWR